MCIELEWVTLKKKPYGLLFGSEIDCDTSPVTVQKYFAYCLSSSGSEITQRSLISHLVQDILFINKAWVAYRFWKVFWVSCARCMTGLLSFQKPAFSGMMMLTVSGTTCRRSLIIHSMIFNFQIVRRIKRDSGLSLHSKHVIFPASSSATCHPAPPV